MSLVLRGIYFGNEIAFARYSSTRRFKFALKSSGRFLCNDSTTLPPLSLFDKPKVVSLQQPVYRLLFNMFKCRFKYRCSLLWNEFSRGAKDAVLLTSRYLYEEKFDELNDRMPTIAQMVKARYLTLPDEHKQLLNMEFDDIQAGMIGDIDFIEEHGKTHLKILVIAFCYPGLMKLADSYKIAADPRVFENAVNVFLKTHTVIANIRFTRVIAPTVDEDFDVDRLNFFQKPDFIMPRMFVARPHRLSK